MNLMGVSISISHSHLFMLTEFLFHWSFDLCNVESSLPYINYFLWRYVTLISKKSLRWCKKLWLKIILKNVYGVSKVDWDNRRISKPNTILKLWMFQYVIFLTLCAPIVQYNSDNDLPSHSNLNSFWFPFSNISLPVICTLINCKHRMLCDFLQLFVTLIIL